MVNLRKKIKIDTTVQPSTRKKSNTTTTSFSSSSYSLTRKTKQSLLLHSFHFVVYSVNEQDQDDGSLPLICSHIEVYFPTFNLTKTIPSPNQPHLPFELNFLHTTLTTPSSSSSSSSTNTSHLNSKNKFNLTSSQDSPPLLIPCQIKLHFYSKHQLPLTHEFELPFHAYASHPSTSFYFAAILRNWSPLNEHHPTPSSSSSSSSSSEVNLSKTKTRTRSTSSLPSLPQPFTTETTTSSSPSSSSPSSSSSFIKSTTHGKQQEESTFDISAVVSTSTSNHEEKSSFENSLEKEHKLIERQITTDIDPSLPLIEGSPSSNTTTTTTTATSISSNDPNHRKRTQLLTSSPPSSSPPPTKKKRRHSYYLDASSLSSSSEESPSLYSHTNPHDPLDNHDKDPKSSSSLNHSSSSSSSSCSPSSNPKTTTSASASSSCFYCLSDSEEDEFVEHQTSTSTSSSSLYDPWFQFSMYQKLNLLQGDQLIQFFRLIYPYLQKKERSLVTPSSSETTVYPSSSPSSSLKHSKEYINHYQKMQLKKTDHSVQFDINTFPSSLLRKLARFLNI